MNYVMRFALIYASISYASELILKMPSKENLEKKLTQAGYSELIKNSDIIDRLASKELYPLGVVYIIREGLFNTDQYDIEEKNIPMYCLLLDTMQANPQLFEAVIEEKWALETLAQKGYYKPQIEKN